MNEALLAVYVVGLGATAWLVIRGYLRTHNAGYIFLLMGLGVWPIVRLGVRNLIVIPKTDALFMGESVELWPFSMVSSGTLSTAELLVYINHFSNMVGGALVLAGVWLVVRGHGNLAESSSNLVQMDGGFAANANRPKR